jgi:hypothetical protein
MRMKTRRRRSTAPLRRKKTPHKLKKDLKRKRSCGGRTWGTWK